MSKGLTMILDTILSLAGKAAVTESAKQIANKLTTFALEKVYSLQKPNQNKLTRKIQSIRTVRTLLSQQNDADIYSFYYPPKLEQFTETTLHNQNFTIIEGIVGQGKSIFMRHLAISLMKNMEEFPIFIELRKVSKEQSITTLIKSYLLESGFSDRQEIVNDILSKNTHLILDGFDELNDNYITETLETIEHLRANFEKIKITISSRPQHEIQKCAGFRIIKIKPLTQEDYDPFIKSIKTVSSEKFKEISNALKNSDKSVMGVITTPLMMILMIRFYLSENKIPSTIPEFYENLFSAVYSLHDDTKPTFKRTSFSNISESELRKIFESFCYFCVESQQKRTVSLIEFKEIFDFIKSEIYEDIPITLNQFKAEITKKTCLMVEESANEITFLHKSIMDYYAASFVRKCEDPAEFYSDCKVNSKKWISLLIFLKDIDTIKFSKFYGIELLESKIKILETAISQHATENFSAEFYNFFKEFYLRFEEFKSHDKSKKSEWITALKLVVDISIYYELIEDIIIKTIFSSFNESCRKNKLTKEEFITSYFEPSRVSDKTQYKIYFMEFASIVDTEKLRDLAKRCHEVLSGELRMLKNAIETERRKTSSLLIKKRKQTVNTENR